MSKLSLGSSMPDGWGFPSPLYNHVTGQYEDDGMVWMKKERCTMEDIEALKDALGDNVNIDIASVFGGASFFERNVRLYPYKRKVVLG